MANINAALFGSGPFLLDAKEGPFASTAAALAAIPAADRKISQPVKILDGSGNAQFYWFKTGTGDSDLVQMTAIDIALVASSFTQIAGANVQEGFASTDIALASKLSTFSAALVSGPDTYNASFDSVVNSDTAGGSNTINLPADLTGKEGRQIVIYQSSGSNQTTISAGANIIVVGNSTSPVSSIVISGYYAIVTLTAIDPATWKLESNVNSYDVLTKNNTTSYTPTGDYNPATKKYVDDSVVGLFDDRGNYDASSNAFPTSGGSGSGGAVLKGDVWTISVAGTLGGVAVTAGDTIRALVDTPGQTASNWATTEINLGYTPENVANKETSALDTSTTKYPCNNVVKTGLDSKAAIADLVSSSFGLARQSSSISSSTTLTSGDYGKTFPVDATSGNVIVTIPDQSALKEIGFYRVDNSATYSVSIIVASLQGVIYPGAVTTVKLAQYEFVKITSDGANYFLSSQYLYTSPFVKTLLDAFDAAEFRSDIGLGDVATLNTISDSYLDSGITSTKVSLTNGKILVGNGSNQAAGVSMSGDATVSNTGSLTIANGAVTNAKIADNTILQAKMGDVRILAFLTVNKSTNTVIASYGCTYSSVGTGEYQVIPASPNSTFPTGSMAVTDAQFPSGVSIQGVSKIAAVSTSYIQVLTEYAGTTYNPEYATCFIVGVV